MLLLYLEIGHINVILPGERERAVAIQDVSLFPLIHFLIRFSNLSPFQIHPCISKLNKFGQLIDASF